MDNLGGVLSVGLIGSLILAIDFAAVPDAGTLVAGLAIVALAAGSASSSASGASANPLYDLARRGEAHLLGRRVAGIIVFGSLMASAFIGQQFMQNVLGYSTLDAGVDHPAALVMVVAAPRSGQLIRRPGRGSRCCRDTCVRPGVPDHVAGLGPEHSTRIGRWAWRYVFIGAGVGLAGTPASHSLTGSVPVTRVGMASGTADLQRDLGGAIMQSAFGALLTAGYAAAMTAAITASPDASEVTSTTQAALTKSFAGASDLAAANPQYATEIIAAARTSFLQGDDWAYLAGIVAVALGAVLVATMFPKRDRERALLAEYAAEDATASAP